MLSVHGQMLIQHIIIQEVFEGILVLHDRQDDTSQGRVRQIRGRGGSKFIVSIESSIMEILWNGLRFLDPLAIVQKPIARVFSIAHFTC